MIINLLRKQHMTSLELPSRIMGQYWISDIEDGEEKEMIAVEGIDGHWELKMNKNYGFEDKNIKSLILQENQIYQLCDHKKESLFIYVEKDDKQSMYKKYQLSADEITIGRNKDNAICLHNMLVSGNHCKLVKRSDAWEILDLHSTNGTFVNQINCNRKELRLGDSIYILGIKIIFGTDFISISMREDVSIDESKLVPMSFIPIVCKETEEYPEHVYFYPSPRMKKDIQERLFKIDSPPDDQIGEEMPFMLVLGPSITMGMSSMATGVFAVSNAVSTGNVYASMPSIIMSFSMLLGTVLWPIITKYYEKRKRHDKEKLRQIKYHTYLDEIEKEIEAETALQKEILITNAPSVQECLTCIKNADRNLWNRTINQNDFLQLRLGIGKKKLSARFSYSERRFSLFDDNLKERLYQICEEEKYIKEVPITFSLFENNICGIVGKKEVTEQTIKNLILQIVTFYSYEDVKLIFLYDKKDVQYDFVKWLPHVFDNSKKNRFIAKDKTQLKELSAYFENVIAYRKQLNANDIEGELPYYVIFSFDQRLGSKFDLIKSVEKAQENLHFSIVYVCEKMKDLPKACSCVIEVSSIVGNLYDLSDLTGEKVIFKPDLVSFDCDEMSRCLSNISVDISENEKLPQVVPFLQMFGVGKISHLNPLLRWKENNPTLSLETPVGIDVQGDIFKLDLHEKYHGPHGLVAGMTGSGKSEFIITYILSLAVNYHPEEVSFILIDYKGGGMAKAFERLPHVAGIITNLDGSSVKRSLISIESELKRRQSIFAQTSKRLAISNIDIYKYQKLYREKKVKDPLSHLFIISDEFAELKTQQPAFMSQLISTARIGRSLGVHLILATQKPSGVVDDQIWSNSRFRICLKVQERADSMDMLKRPEAAELSETGRFYLQVGYNEMFELGQSAWTGAAYYPSDKVVREIDNSVAIINMSGREIAKSALNYQKSRYGEASKQLDEITAYLAKTAENENICIRPIWLPPLQETIYYQDLIQSYSYQKEGNRAEMILGKYDDPLHQKQGLLTMQFAEKGNIAIYESSGSGTNMLFTMMLYSLCRNYTPQEVQMYIMDFSGGVLSSFQQAPQIGDVILTDDVEKVTNLLNMLRDIVEKRRKEFANFGGNIQFYNTYSKKRAHEIIVFINNISSFNEVYEEKEDILTYLMREGNAYGVYFVVSTSSVNGIRYRMQQYFSSALALRMNDESDYLAIVGKTDGLLPKNCEGRGLVKIDGDIYEFQTAVAVGKHNSYQDIQAACTEMASLYEKKAKAVPVLPKTVDMVYLQSYYQGDLIVPIGVDYATLEVYQYDLSGKYIHCIASLHEDHSKLLRGILTMISKQVSVYYLDLYEQSLDERIEGSYSSGQCEKAIDKLFEIVLYRNNSYKEAENPSAAAQDFEPIIICINHVSEIYTQISDLHVEKLDLILEKGSSDYKISIILSDHTAFHSLTYKSWFKSCMQKNEFIWLGEGIMEQYTFQPAKKAPVLASSVESGSGFVIQASSVHKLKLISIEKGDRYE